MEEPGIITLVCGTEFWARSAPSPIVARESVSSNSERCMRKDQEPLSLLSVDSAPERSEQISGRDTDALATPAHEGAHARPGWTPQTLGKQLLAPRRTRPASCRARRRARCRAGGARALDDLVHIGHEQNRSATRGRSAKARLLTAA